MDEGKCTSMLIVIFTLYLAFTVVVPHPSTTDDWVISINKFALFNILKDTNPQNDPITMEVAQSVLSRILAEKDISMEDVNTSKASESMLSNLRRLASQFKKASSQSGTIKEALLRLWEKSFIGLKLGGAKRELELQLKLEKEKRELAEEQLKAEKEKRKKKKHKIKKLQDSLKQVTSNLLRKTKKALRKKPSDVSNDYKKKKKRDLLDTANSTIELLNVLGITVSDLGVVDEFGNRINLKDGKKVKVGKRKEVKTKVKEISVDKALYLERFLVHFR